MNTPQEPSSPTQTNTPAPAAGGAVAAPPQQAALENIRGVFSTQEIRRVGTGTTTRQTVQKNFWFVEQNAAGIIQCQPLNSNYVPAGPKRTLSMEELINKFSPEPEFYLSSVFPKMQELQRTIDAADEHREKNELFAAEYEYSTALKVDEDNVRANFGIGLTYLQRGENDKAEDIFQRLVKLDAAFGAEHKHLFNDFGINLRKNRMFLQAINYYGRALELTGHDENLHINMARALLESNNIPGCVEHLFTALELAPAHENALKFLDWLVKKNMVPMDKQERAQQLLTPAGNGTTAPDAVEES